MQNSEIDYAIFEQVCTPRGTEKINKNRKIHLPAMCVRLSVNIICSQAKTKIGGNMNIRNEIKSYIVREGLTMSEVVEKLVEEHGWSASVPNFSGKLQRGSLRYSEAKELADVLGYELVWQKRGRR